MAKINKALDYNKLLQDQAQGKLLKKKLKFPLYASIKYDGNYVTVRRENGRTTFTTSGGLNYSHTDNGGDCFDVAADGVYIAERVAGLGKLGDRVRCNLRGPKTAQTSTGHSYKIHFKMTLEEYDAGATKRKFSEVMNELLYLPVGVDKIVMPRLMYSIEEVEDYLRCTVRSGYEGIMLIDPDWQWSNTKSRKINFCKYKKRPTVDLLCIGETEGTGKYEGMIGALVLKDSKGRVVSVGSGLSDESRLNGDFVGKVVEIRYEQLLDTYIQPTFISVRHDKTKEEID